MPSRKAEVLAFVVAAASLSAVATPIEKRQANSSGAASLPSPVVVTLPIPITPSGTASLARPTIFAPFTGSNYTGAGQNLTAIDYFVQTATITQPALSLTTTITLAGAELVNYGSNYIIDEVYATNLDGSGNAGIALNNCTLSAGRAVCVAGNLIPGSTATSFIPLTTATYNLTSTPVTLYPVSVAAAVTDAPGLLSLYSQLGGTLPTAGGASASAAAATSGTIGMGGQASLSSTGAAVSSAVASAAASGAGVSSAGTSSSM